MISHAAVNTSELGRQQLYFPHPNTAFDLKVMNNDASMELRKSISDTKNKYTNQGRSWWKEGEGGGGAIVAAAKDSGVQEAAKLMEDEHYKRKKKKT